MEREKLKKMDYERLLEREYVKKWSDQERDGK